jgi:16S rRNA (adenine1518-N6/adenine1519-N6)-dimethyltransferase
VEIGPGLGAITQHLVKLNKPIIAIELDKRLCEHIKHECPQVTTINNDVIQVNWDMVLKNYKQVALISNLPYSISSVVLGQFIHSIHFTDAWFMLQKEMVNRITGLPSTKQYNGFTAFVQFYTTIRQQMNVSKNNFYPIPEVDSIVVSIHKTVETVSSEFEKFLKLTFASKRKTLANNLKQTYDIPHLNKTLDSLLIDKNTRAEALTPAMLYKLFKEL